MMMIPQAPGRSALEQEQFLKILSREDAMARFEAALFPRAIPSRVRKLGDALGAAGGGFRGGPPPGMLQQAQQNEMRTKMNAAREGVMRRNLSEDEAFHALRKLAMSKKVRLGEVAQQVIESAELLGKA